MSSPARAQRFRTMRSGRTWWVAAALAVGSGVAFSVLLMSVSDGVAHDLHRRLAIPALRDLGVINVGRIDTILTLLTAVVTGAMLLETAAATFTIGVVLMRSRRAEIAIRRQSGVLRSRLVREFVVEMLRPVVSGAVVGELVGVTAGWLLTRLTVLPVRFTLVSLFAAFPTTVLLATLATLVPAWSGANASPGRLRKEG